MVGSWLYKMAINYLTTYKKYELKEKKEKIYNKRKLDEIEDNDNDNDNDYVHVHVHNDTKYMIRSVIRPTMQPINRALRNKEICKKIAIINKKMKIDSTIFAPKIVSGILIPTLPKGFMPIPDYEDESDYEDDYHQDNLLLLSEVISILEKL